MLGPVEWRRCGAMWRMRARSGHVSAKALKDALEDFYVRTPDERAKIRNHGAWLTDRYERIAIARKTGHSPRVVNSDQNQAA